MENSTLHRRITLALKAILTVGALLAIYEQQWLTLATTLAIIGLTFLPMIMGRRLNVFIPPEFECMATVFVFASLFLGEVRGYYGRFWWWDISLHTASGVLLGIVGFLLVYILNEKEDINVQLTPGFVALFAFMFAVGMGALWEIFEFTMDKVGGFNMQKPMFGDASGLTDTMWDLIVDAVGALFIALLGLGYLRNWGSSSFLERWIQAFIRGNPGLFRRKS